jgi:hypothetical protein
LTAYRRELFVFEIERCRTITQARNIVGWTDTAYWSQRHRHPDWADDIDNAAKCHWSAGSYGRATALDGRAVRGALQRRAFLHGIRSGNEPSFLCRLMKWSPAAYYQARYRHPDWAQLVDHTHRQQI